MARKTTTSRRERRQHSSKLLSRLGLALVIAVPLLYFTFTKTFFDPFEGTMPPFEELAPRDVDLFVHRTDLALDVSEFPDLRITDRLGRARAFKELSATAWWQGLSWPKELASAAAAARGAVKDAPLDPVADLLGREVALLARLPDAGGGDASFAVMARLSDKAKLAVEAFDFAFARDKALPGALFERIDDPDVPGLGWNKLTPPGEAPWFYARQKDLLVAGPSESLVRDVLRSAQGGREASLGLSRLWHDHLPRGGALPSGGGTLSADLLVDVAQLLARTEGDEALGQRNEDALANALDRLFDPTLFREAVVRVELGDRLAFSAHAEVDAARASLQKNGLVGSGSFVAAERLGHLARMLPPDTSFFVALQSELRPLLTTLSTAFDTDLLALMNGMLRDVQVKNPGWQVGEVSQLIAHLDRALTGEIAVAARPLDHKIPEGSQPLPLLAIFARLRDVGPWNELDNAMVRGYQALGVRERWEADEGVGMRRWMVLPEGLPIEEISWIVLDRETLVIATDEEFLREIVATYTRSRSALHGRAEVAEMIGRLGEQRANVAAWGAASELLRLLDPYADWIADEDTRLDFGILRASRRKELLSGEFRQWQGKVEEEIPEDVRARIDARLDEIVNALEATRLSETIPAAARAWREKRAWLKLLQGGVFALRLGERDASLALRADLDVSP